LSYSDQAVTFFSTIFGQIVGFAIVALGLAKWIDSRNTRLVNQKVSALREELFDRERGAIPRMEKEIRRNTKDIKDTLEGIDDQVTWLSRQSGYTETEPTKRRRELRDLRKREREDEEESNNNV
jgi:hypothetical protein